MRILIDTHVLIWLSHEPQRLSAEQVSALSHPDNEIFVSAVSVWEIAVKRAKGRLRFEGSPTAAIRTLGFAELPVSALHGETAASLPPHHRDPFDRLLIAQAITEQLMLMTHDEQIMRYPVALLRV